MKELQRVKLTLEELEKEVYEEYRFYRQHNNGFGVLNYLEEKHHGFCRILNALEQTNNLNSLLTSILEEKVITKRLVTETRATSGRLYALHVTERLIRKVIQ